MAITHQPTNADNRVKLVLAWGFVGIPLVWGIVQTLVSAIGGTVAAVLLLAGHNLTCRVDLS